MEMLGLIDALEATILSGSKIPLTDKVVLNESQLLQIVDKLRTVVKNGSHIVQDTITGRSSELLPRKGPSVLGENTEASADDVIQNSLKKAMEIRDGADQYADQILANLLIAISRIQRNAAKMETAIQQGRERINRVKQGLHDPLP